MTVSNLKNRKVLILIIPLALLCCICFFVLGLIGSQIPSSDIQTPTTDQQEDNSSKGSVENKNFELNEEVRQEIYMEITTNEEKARTESESKYPWIPGQEGYKEENFLLANEYKDQLNEQYKQEILNKYKIDSKTYTLIILEGIDKNW